MTYTPDESKKPALFEIFRAAVWADLIPEGTQELQTAIDTASSQGVGEQDLNWLDTLDARNFADYFGTRAIGKDLQNAMKAADAQLSGLNYTPVYSNKGYY